MSARDSLNEDALDAVTAALLAAYDEDRDDAARDRPRLPAREAIVAVVEQIRRLLFPGFYADEALPRTSRRYWVGTWLCQLHSDLTRVTTHALAHDDAQTALADHARRGRTIARGLLEALPDIRRQLLLDAEAALDGDPAAGSIDEVILTYPGFLAITVHRVAHWLYLAKVPFIPRAMSEHAHTLTGIDLHPGARIGARFFIDHGTGVVVGETTDIGDNVKIYQGVTLGALSVHRRLAGAKRHPTIQDEVVIYAGATVLGGRTTIGRGAVIGGNVWITRSVEPGTTVIESPPTLDYRRPEGADEAAEPTPVTNTTRSDHG